MFDFLVIISKHKRPLSGDILSQFINCKIDGVTFEYKTAQWTLSERRDRFALFCADDAPEKHIAAENESIRFFDGMIFQDNCINDIRRLSPILGNNTDHSDVFGRYIYGEITETGISHIHRDVLGFEPLFMGFASELTVISNNPALCAQAVHGKKYKQHKNAIGLAQVAFMGATQDLSTSFHGVFFVPQNAGILIDKENNVSFYPLVDKMYYPMSCEEWDLQFEKTRQTCVNLLSKANIQNGTITGGYDSRMTLALAIEAGIHKNIQFSVTGFGDHPDVIIAKQIADYYGLKLEHNEAVVADNENRDSIIEQSFNNALRDSYKQSGMREFFENWALTQNLLNPTQTSGFVTLSEAERSAVKQFSDERQMFRLRGYAAPLNMTTGFLEKPIYQMTANGAANETFRGYFSLHKLLEQNKPNKIMNSKDREFLINDKIKKDMLSENAYCALHDKLEKHFETYEDLYSYDLNYMQTRAPQYHGGLNNRKGFSIGMNPWLHRLSMIQAPELRAGGQAAFKLIEGSAPELLYFPFADKKWHYYAYAGNKNEEKIKKIQPCVNINKRPLPSMTNSIKQMKFLFDRNVKIHDDVWKICNEQYLSGLINDVKKIVSENIMTNPWAPARLINIYGISLFLNNAELPVAQNENSCRLNNSCHSAQGRRIYEFIDPATPRRVTTNVAHSQNAETVCRRGDLLFSDSPVFRSSDHNHLTTFQKTLLGINDESKIKVSVVIPIYNAEKYLRQCLDSVANQTLKDIEIICVNDGSTDNSLEILKEYENKDKRFVIVNQQNQGAGAARNNGLDIAKGQYVYFLDGDDFIENNAFDALFKKAEKTDADITLFSFVKFNSLTGAKQYDKRFESDKFKNLKVFSRLSLPNDILNITTTQAWNKFYKRSFIKDNRIKFQNLKTCNDIYFSYLSLMLAGKVTFVNKPFIVWREVQRDNITASRGDHSENIFAAYEKLKTDLHKIFGDEQNAQDLINERFAEHFRYEYQFVGNDKAAEYVSEVKRLLPERYFSAFIDKILKVAVIIPVYNVENYLRPCLDSVVNQTLKEIEIICINDGSTDSSLEILKEYAKKDKRFIVIDQKNAGLSASRNVGLDAAKSKHIMFIDSDDYIHKDLLKTCYDNITQSKADVAVYHFEAFADDESVRDITAGKNKWGDSFRHKTGLHTFDGNFSSYCSLAWNKLFKADIIAKNNLRFPAGLINEDEAWHWFYFSFVKSIYFIDIPLYCHRVRNNSIMINRNINFVGIFDIISILELVYKFLNERNLYQTHKTQYRQFYEKRTGALLWYCREKKDLLVEAKIKVREFALKYELISPSVSVIIPVYNAEKHLRQCLNSMLNQTLENIEIICVNDGSSDGSQEILKEYAKKDSRIIIIDQENSGQGTAKNNGLKIARGEYIGFVDSDDWVSADFYLSLYNAAKAKNADIAATGNVLLFENADTGGNKNMGFDKPAMLKSVKEKKDIVISSGAIWNKIYKKELVEKNKITFSPAKCVGEDNIFNIISAATANIIVCTMSGMYFYRQRSDSCVNSRNAKDLDITDIYKSILLRLSELRLPSQWNKIVRERMKLDFSYFYRDFDHKLKKEFLSKVIQSFPELKFERFIEIQGRKLIVSLTSYPARIASVHIAVESLLNQTKKADKVILWLAEEQFPNKEADLPTELIDLTKKGLAISWCKDIKSYKKLIPALKEYPDSVIVTADDDNIYPKNWLEKLYQAYLKNPQMVHCRRAHLITFEKDLVLPYQKWNWDVTNVKPSFLNFFTGVGGVLYPPDIFHKDISDKELFMNLCPHGDDIWFWAMAVLNNVKINAVKDDSFDINIIKGTEDTSLWHENVLQGKNDEQLRNVFKQYPELLEKIKAEYKTLRFWLMLRRLYCKYHEPNHKVFKILGLKIKIRNNKREKMKKFFKNLINVYNDGDYKVFAFLFIRVKIKNKHKILITHLEQNQKQIAALNDKMLSLDGILKNVDKQVSGLVNAQKFQSAILGSKWLKEQNFTVSGWAMDNLGLYTVLRILNDIKPQNILEFGLGQSSKLVHQYTAFNNNNAKALTVEHDKQWIEFFLNETPGYKMNIKVYDSAKVEINGAETLSYAGLKELYNQKFDFILVDGPIGQKRYSRPQILDFVKAGMPDRFCILIDDTEREGEKETLNALFEILKEQKINFLIRTYTGEKNSHSVICSPDLKFLTSL